MAQTTESKDPYFVKSILVKKISLPMSQVGSNLKEVIHYEISNLVEGKCSIEGYIKKHSVQIISHTCGLVCGARIVFDITFSCQIFLPCAGMILDNGVISSNLDSAGIEVKSNQSPNFYVAFIYQDFNFGEDTLKGKVGDAVSVRVIDYRFEIYDEYITIVGEIV
jgi:DNA-directed RNA polymerase subunit E'/Rpb7